MQISTTVLIKTKISSSFDLVTRKGYMINSYFETIMDDVQCQGQSGKTSHIVKKNLMQICKASSAIAVFKVLKVCICQTTQ